MSLFLVETLPSDRLRWITNIRNCASGSNFRVEAALLRLISIHQETNTVLHCRLSFKSVGRSNVSECITLCRMLSLKCWSMVHKKYLWQRRSKTIIIVIHVTCWGVPPCGGRVSPHQGAGHHCNVLLRQRCWCSKHWVSAIFIINFYVTQKAETVTQSIWNTDYCWKQKEIWYLWHHSQHFDQTVHFLKFCEPGHTQTYFWEIRWR